jgi:hypothetical protein
MAEEKLDAVNVEEMKSAYMGNNGINAKIVWVVAFVFMIYKGTFVEAVEAKEFVVIIDVKMSVYYVKVKVLLLNKILLPLLTTSFIPRRVSHFFVI